MAKNARLATTTKTFVQFVVVYHLVGSVCASFFCVSVVFMLFPTFLSTLVVFDVVEGDRIKIDPIYLIETLH